MSETEKTTTTAAATAADPKDVQIAELTKRLAELEAAKTNTEETSLADKARIEREKQEKSSGDEKSLESALRFSMQSKDWLKTNSNLLPKTIEGIFVQADKENYGNAIEKASAIKVGVISEFFTVQANMDLLTPAQKTALEDFQKLTKNGKQDKAQNIYDMVFEPAFETLKRVKKAEQLQKGLGTQTDVESAYKQKLIKGSRKHYLGEKQNA